MSHGHGDFRRMGNFKALALDYQFWLSNGTDGALYCLNQRDISILLALCEYVGWFTRWINTEDTSAAEIRAIQGALELKLMECVDITVLIEQSQQLVDQANLNLYVQVQNQDIASQALRDLLEDRYDGTPTSINPSAPTTDFGASGDRYDALCAGLVAFVYGFARVQADHLRLAQVSGLIAVGLVAALLIPGLALFLIVGASIAVLLGAGVIGVSTEVAIEALTDQDALGNVICCMRDYLKAQSVTEAHWDACLSGCSFAGGSHEQIIADFITPMLASNYLTILNILGQAYDGVLGGDDLPECPCDPTVWTHNFPDASVWSDFTLLTIGGATTTVVGDKLVGATDSTNAVVLINFKITVDASITSIATDFEWSTTAPAEFDFYIDGTLAAQYIISGVGTHTLTWTGTSTGSHEYSWLSGVYGTIASGSYDRVTAVRFGGTGIDPFV